MLFFVKLNSYLLFHAGRSPPTNLKFLKISDWSNDRNNALSAFEQRGKGTVELALEKPNLFRFLYMGDRNQILSTGFQFMAKDDSFYKIMADDLGMSVEQTEEFCRMMVIYTQGIGTLIASGIVQDTKENMFQMIHNTGITYLKGLGVKMEDEVYVMNKYFNIYGLIFVILILIPNIVFACSCKDGFENHYICQLYHLCFL